MKFTKYFFATMSGALLIGVFSFSLSQHSSPPDSTSSHSQSEKHSQQDSDEDENNVHKHQHGGMTEMLTEEADVKFTLATSWFERKRIFIGVSSNIKGQINPTLEIPQGAVVEITLLNDTVLQHNFVIPKFSFTF